MNKLILLDTGVLGFVVHGNEKISRPAIDWLQQHLKSGNQFRVPEIADYELRRSLIRLNSLYSISNLDKLKIAVGFLAIDSATMLEAANLWALARVKGFATANDDALDGDVILAAQAKLAAGDHSQKSVIVATTNVGHLVRFVQAKLWTDIKQ